MKIRIRAVKEREGFVNELLQQLPENTEVIRDKYRNATETFCRATDTDEPCIHLEDDVVLGKNFFERAMAEIEKRPDDVITFFSMKKTDVAKGSRYEPGRTFCMAQSFYIPKGLGPKISEYVKTARQGEAGHPLDLAMGDYLQSIKKPYWIVVPNLCNARETVSIIDKRRSSRRFSTSFIG